MRISDWSSDVCSSDLQKTLRSAVVPKENPHLHYLDIKHFGPHSAGTVQRNFDYNPDAQTLTWVYSQMLPTSAPDKQAIAEGRAGFYEHPGLHRLKIPRSEERRVGKECVRTCRSRG